MPTRLTCVMPPPAAGSRAGLGPDHAVLLAGGRVARNGDRHRGRRAPAGGDVGPRRDRRTSRWTGRSGCVRRRRRTSRFAMVAAAGYRATCAVDGGGVRDLDPAVDDRSRARGDRRCRSAPEGRRVRRPGRRASRSPMLPAIARPALTRAGACRRHGDTTARHGSGADARGASESRCDARPAMAQRRPCYTTEWVIVAE